MGRSQSRPSCRHTRKAGQPHISNALRKVAVSLCRWYHIGAFAWTHHYDCLHLLQILEWTHRHRAVDVLARCLTQACSADPLQRSCMVLTVMG